MSDADKELLSLGAEPHDDELQALGAISPDQQQFLASYMSQPEGPSTARSFLGGTEQGLTLGHADELGAAFGAGLDKASNGGDLEQLYNEYLQANRKRYNEMQQAHPGASIVGNVVGGVLGTMGAGMALAPVAAAAGEAAPAASGAVKVLNRVAPGAIPGAIMGAVAGEGNSEFPITSPETLQNTLEGAGTGAATGVLVPPALGALKEGAEATASGIKSGAKNTGEVIESLLTGKMGKAFKRGFGDTRQNREWNIGDTAQNEHSQQGLMLGESLASEPQAATSALAKQKNEIIQAAASKGIKISDDDIQNFIDTQLSKNPRALEDNVKNEIGKFHDMILRARNGEEVETVKRVFFGEGNTEEHKIVQKMLERQIAQQAEQAPGVPALGPNTQGFTGYKKVMSRRITPDEVAEGETSQLSHGEGKTKFETDVEAKRAEQKALGGHIDESPIEVHYEPIEGSDDLMAIARQPQFEAGTQTAIVPSQGNLSIETQPIPGSTDKLVMVKQEKLDAEGNLVGYKIVDRKRVPASQAAKFQDVTETTRMNPEYDLSNPKDLYEVYKKLRIKTDNTKFPWEAEHKFQTPEAQQATKEAMVDINSLLRQNIPELTPIDTQIGHYNRALETLDAPPINIDMKETPTEIAKKLINVVNKSGGNTTDAVAAKNALSHYMNQLRIANPEMAHQLEARMKDWLERGEVLGATQESVYLPRPASRPQPLASKVGAIAGYSFGYMTPNWVRSTASALTQQGSKAAAGLGQILSTVAEKDEQTRNALMWGIMQNPAYREILKPYMPEEDKK